MKNKILSIRYYLYKIKQKFTKKKKGDSGRYTY